MQPQYLYIYNYSPNEKELCEMEFRQIFHDNMTSKYYLTNQNFDYQRSVYIKGKLNIICTASTIEEIVEQIESMYLVYYNFKVIYLKNEGTPVDYQESIEWCKKIAFPIEGSNDFKHPSHVLAITKLHDLFIFGDYEDDMIWSERYEKPHSYSHSLNVRDARTLVNIAVGNRKEMKIVDPCCGVGTVVLEALSMGIDIKGFDINRYVAYQARLNLEHFGYDPLIIQRRDIHELYEKFDAIIMDIPYGVYSPFTYEQQLSLLEATLHVSNRLVLVSHIPMNKELENLNYQIKDQCSITKGNFTRYITLCER